MADRNIAIAVLAAGASRRFGEGDKLTAMFRGRMLGEAVCASVPQGCFDRRWVIASAQHHPCAAAWHAHGFDIAINPDASVGMGTSVALAARIALEVDCDALVIALADMPLVPPEHFTALTARIAAASADAIIVSQAGGKRMPPAAFGADRCRAVPVERRHRRARNPDGRGGHRLSARMAYRYRHARRCSKAWTDTRLAS